MVSIFEKLGVEFHLCILFLVATIESTRGLGKKCRTQDDQTINVVSSMSPTTPTSAKVNYKTFCSYCIEMSYMPWL